MNTFRIHGDNIVECERIANIIINTVAPDQIGSYLVSPSTIAIEFRAVYLRTLIEWRFELLPGFNKNQVSLEWKHFRRIKRRRKFL